jgi:hypothetical protein
MRPLVGSSKPPTMRSVVVLPQPDGPSRAKNVPRGIARSSASTAVVSPKRLVTPSSSMSAAADCVPAGGVLTAVAPIRATLPVV